MFHYILTTDFSKGSQKALNYAANIANKTNANITLLWVDNSTNLIYEEEDNTIREEGRKSLNDEYIRIKNQYPDLKIEKKIRSGKVYQEISNFVKNVQNPMIVLSSHGASGYKDLWIGSNANRIISNVSCPTLIIRRKNELNENLITQILLPIDHTTDTLKKLNYIIPFAKINNAQLKIVALYSKLLASLKIKVDNNLAEAKNIIDKSKIDSKYETIYTDNVSKDLLDFISNSECDMVIIMNEQNNNNSLIGELPLQIINQSSIPVLSIPSIELNSVN